MTDKEKETFQFFKNIFDSHLQKKYPDVDKFNKGQRTEALSKIIPLPYLKKLVRYYRLFDKIAVRPKNPTREISKFSNNPLNVPLKDISSIEMLLENLEQKKWLQVNDALNMMNLFYKKIIGSPKVIERDFQLAKGKFRGSGRWPNYALYFIVFFLVTCAKKIAGRPHFLEIAYFLDEQDIVLDKFDADSVTKIYKRPSDVWALYDSLMHNFEKEFFDGLFKYPDIPVHLRENFRKFCLPEMIEFHPCHPRWKETILPE